MYTHGMTFNSKYISFVILIVSALTLSRGILFLFNDPEGPNLLIVGVFAGIIFGVSIMMNYFHSGTLVVKGTTRMVISIATQIVVAATLYFFLK